MALGLSMERASQASRKTFIRQYLQAWIAAAMALTALWSAPACAQSVGTQLLSTYLGQNVSSIDIAGRPDVTLDQISRLLSVQKDKPLTQADIDASVAALKKSGQFDNVWVSAQPTPDGVRVQFILEPGFYLGMYQFPGGLKEYAYSRLLQVSNYSTPSAYSAQDVTQGENNLVQFFRRDGFFLAEVRPEPITDTAHHLVNVDYHIDLGQRAKIGKVELKGANPQETQLLNRKLRSLMARLRGGALKPGMTFSQRRLQSAEQFLQGALTKQDYLAGNVKLVSAEYDPNTNRADVTFNVETGRVIRVKVVGAKVWGRTVRSLVPIYQENIVNDELIREGQRNIVSYFQAKGYFNTVVKTSVTDNPKGQLIVYNVNKDGRHKVDEVSFKGNQHFDAKELESHVSVKEAHFFSHGKYSEELVRASAKNLKNLYASVGYSHAAVTPTVKRDNGNVEITFQVVEGPVDMVQELRIEGATLPEQQIAPHGLKLGPGKPYSQLFVGDDRSQILARYLSLGYLNASFRATAKPVPGQPNQVAVTYEISEGPQVTTATIVTTGRQHTQQAVIDRQLRVRPGKPMDQNTMLSSESHLYNLGIFDWAEVDPKNVITDQKTEDVVVKVHEAKRNSIIYGFGFEVVNRGGSVPSGTVAVPGIPPIGLPSNFKTSEKTFWGPRGTFQYTRRNVRGRAESYTFGAFAGRLDQRASFTYTDPYFRGSKWKGSALFSIEHDAQNPIFTARLGNAGYQFERPWRNSRKTTVFLRYNYQVTRISNLLIPELVPPNQLNVRLSTLAASFIHDTRDNVLDAHKGWYYSAELDANPSWLGSNFSFGKFLGQVAHYRNVGKGIIWANSLRLGLEGSFGNSEVPLSSRFFTGGGSTLRGFPLNGAGPQQTITVCGTPGVISTCAPITVPQGGNQLFILNSELRFPLDKIKKNLGIVTFYDGGNVFPTVGLHDFTALYSNSVGLGFRYATPVGPLRFDVGRNLNPIPGIKATQYFVTLGQAF